jgi:hypothetical protein
MEGHQNIPHFFRKKLQEFNCWSGFDKICKRKKKHLLEFLFIFKYGYFKNFLRDLTKNLNKLVKLKN